MRDHRWRALEMASRRLLLPASGLCLLVIGACAVGPNFRPPKPHVPDAWAGQTAPSGVRMTPAREQDLVRWWNVFGDPMLTSLIERAAGSNLDLRAALARIDQAKATRSIAEAAFWPTVTSTESFTRTRTPASAPAGAGTAGAAGTTGGSSTTGGGSSTGSASRPVSASTHAVFSKVYRVALSVTWAIDVFGGIRRSVEASKADLQAAEEDRQDALVTLGASVASTYIDLRGFQEQIRIAQENLAAQKHTAEVTRKRFMGGFVGALDVSNADAQVATTAAQIPTLETSARQSIYSLSVLLGCEPATLVQDLSTSSPIPSAPPAVPVGVPSDLLRRRPDIRRAEAQLHGATARVGVATAALFPAFTLTAAGNLTYPKYEGLWRADNRSWSVTPAMSVPVFEGGGLFAGVREQKALEQQSLLAYQKTVLTALQDVENALVASAKEQERRRALVDSVAANRKAVELSLLLYTQGESDFLNVLTAQKSLLSAENDLAQSNQNIAADLVALYKALGGGWSEEKKP
ncbi:MAG: efflux transporter outer membrane subunit [Candidatus Sumerlaeota bacterium]|nr:efflux transporter outer membrane subunit [Candidatus Sumerlaeota bacterium]